MCVWERESRKERDSKNWEMWWENICNSSISITTHSLSLRSIFVLLTCFLCYYSLVFVSPSFSFIQYFLLFAHCWSAATKCIPFKLWIKKNKKTKRKSSQAPSLIKHIQAKSKPSLSAFDTWLNLVFTALRSHSYITETRMLQYISIMISFSWHSLAAIVCWTATLSITHYKNKTRTKVAFACDIKLFHTTISNII